MASSAGPEVAARLAARCARLDRVWCASGQPRVELVTSCCSLVWDGATWSELELGAVDSRGEAGQTAGCAREKGGDSDAVRGPGAGVELAEGQGRSPELVVAAGDWSRLGRRWEEGERKRSRGGGERGKRKM